MPKVKRPLSVRFWERVSVGAEADCWEWTGYRVAAGYGRIGNGERENRPLYTHRVSYALHFGPVPAGLDVLHRCDNPPCCNPAHLFLGTQADNGADMVVKGRSYRGPTWCAKPAPLREAILVAYVAGEGNQRELGLRFGVHQSTISRWLSSRAQPLPR